MGKVPFLNLMKKTPSESSEVKTEAKVHVQQIASQNPAEILGGVVGMEIERFTYCLASQTRKGTN